MRSAIVITGLLAASTSAELYSGLSQNDHSCSIQPAYRSCSKKANPASADTCCTETFGGLILSTQFWDTWSENPLPPNEFTLHGLWPDFCNGSYTQYCDLSRQYDPFPSPNTTNGLPNGTVVPAYDGAGVDTFLEAFGLYDLLAWMNKHWVAQTGPNHILWAHEFSKHGTCYSTFDLPCYGANYVEHEEFIDYVETAIRYQRQLPTWQWLAGHGILPSNSTGYTKSDLENALTEEYGAVPYLGCSGPRYNETDAGKAAKTNDTGRTVLGEVWYFRHVNGRPQDGHAVPVDSPSVSGCTNATNALWYYEQTAQDATKY
ncbi:ribonuclease t2 like protein [Zymoseptoria brevis]|uniref:ribonuclease T2 n=1 Tax=Zymoseptoria brevis TaxID=1047168 RepID=A0A0F4GQ14_9PEZI|nr:ribonuclease t2 like protein [Zymoseptoria brevis]